MKKKWIYISITAILIALCIVAYITKNNSTGNATKNKELPGESIEFEETQSQSPEALPIIIDTLESQYDILSVLDNDYDISDIRTLLGRDNNGTWVLSDGNLLTYYEDNSIAYTFYDGYTAIADNNMTFKDYTLAVIECESGTLNIELLQQILNCKGCMTRRCNEGCTYTFSQSENKAVVAEFDKMGNCVGLYRIY